MSRKFLVPIALPGNPVAALEAAPKQYVDLMNEVYIGPTDPGAGYDLWVDDDAPSSGVPMIASNIAYTPTAPMTATDVQAALAQVAWGIVKKGTFLASGTIPAPGNAIAVTNPLVATALAGRRYRVCVLIRALNPAAACFHRLTLRNNGVALNANQPLVYGPAASYNVINWQWLLDGDGASKSLDVTVSADGTSAAFYTDSDCSYFYIEDVGPAR